VSVSWFENIFMQPPSSSPPPQGGKGLPAFLPPSGAHIVKLFVVPLLIVGGLLLAAYAFLLITGGSVLRSPESYLADLRNGNPDVRWRAAQDLAQVLPRDEPGAAELASNPTFGLELAVDLGKSLDELADAEKSVEKKQKDDPEANLASERKDLDARRNFTLFLSSCVGSLRTPVGVEPLKRMALEGAGGPADVRATLRLRALWALANLGQNLKRFDALSPERRQAVIAGFEGQAGAEGERGQWAKASAAYLKERQEGRDTSLGVDTVLVRCMSDSNPFLREVAVFATNFWPGGTDVEDALVARLNDKGAGEDQLAESLEGAKNLVVQFRKNEGLGIRYQAVVALARRGSSQTPLDVLAEMLDESKQMELHKVRLTKDGRESVDPAAAYGEMENALKAIVELHHKNTSMNLTVLETPLEKLSKSDNPQIRQEAEQTREALKK
jgi:hypothetical protein